MPRVKSDEMSPQPGEILDVVRIANRGVIVFKQHVLHYLEIDKDTWLEVYAGSKDRTAIAIRGEEVKE